MMWCLGMVMSVMFRYGDDVVFRYGDDVMFRYGDECDV